MKKPRTTFAAPFVLVLGCGQPHEHASSPHRHHRHHSLLSDAGVDEPIDAAIDAPVDAPIDAITDGVPIDVMCAQPWKYKVICNPAPPQGPVPAGWPGSHPPPPTGNPPPPSRIIRQELASDHLVITVSGGSDQGIARDWTAKVVDANGKPLSGGEGTIIRVSKDTTVVRVRLTIDQLAHARVQFSPP